MKVRDKASYVIYNAYEIKQRASLILELGLKLDVQPTDVIIELAEANGYLILDRSAFDGMFDVVVMEE